MDPSVQIALVGVITALVTTGGIIAVAILNSKKERVDTADHAVEATLRERIVLRDEQILDLKEDKARLQASIDRLQDLVASMKTIPRNSGGE